MKNSDLLLKDLFENQEILEGKALDYLVQKEADSFKWESKQSSPLSPVVSAESQKETFKIQLEALLSEKEEIKRIDRGMKLIYDYLKICSGGQASLTELEKVAEKLFEEALQSLDVFSEFVEKDQIDSEEDTQNDENISLELPSFAEHLCLSKDVLKQIYELAQDLYNKDLIEDAVSVVQTLTFFDSTKYEIWLFLGICEQRLNNYYQAIYAYTMASLIDTEDPLPYLYCTQCFIALRDFAQAEECLISAKERNAEKGPLLDSIIKQVEEK